MGVGTDQTQCRYTRVTSLAFGPSLLLVDHFYRHPVPWNVWAGLFEVQLLRQRTGMDCHHGFDQTRHATGGLQVTNVGFDRTNQQRIIVATAFTVHRRGSREFHRIAVLGARSMSL